MLKAKNTEAADIQANQLHDETISETKLGEMLAAEIKDMEVAGIEADAKELWDLASDVEKQKETGFAEQLALKKENFGNKVQEEIGYKFHVVKKEDWSEEVRIEDTANNSAWEFATVDLGPTQLATVGTTIDEIFEETYFAEDNNNFEINLTRETIKKETEEVAAATVEGTEATPTTTPETKPETTTTNQEQSETPKTEEQMTFDNFLEWFENVGDSLNSSTEALDNISNDQTPAGMQKNIGKAKRFMNTLKQTGKDVVTHLAGYLPAIAATLTTFFGITDGQINKMYAVLKDKWGIDMLSTKTQYMVWKEEYTKLIETLDINTITPWDFEKWLLPKDFKKNKEAYLATLKLTPLWRNQKTINALMKKKEPSLEDAQNYMWATAWLAAQVSAETGTPEWLIKVDYLINYKYSANWLAVLKNTWFPPVPVTWSSWKWGFKEMDWSKYPTYWKEAHELSWYKSGKDLASFSWTTLEKYVTANYANLNLDMNEIAWLVWYTGNQGTEQVSA